MDDSDAKDMKRIISKNYDDSSEGEDSDAIMEEEGESEMDDDEEMES